MAPCQVTDDYYEILGVEQSAGRDAIRASYKRLALKHHPDRNPNNPKATAQFQLLETAYSTLFDPDRRRIYNLQYASIRAQRPKRADTSSKNNTKSEKSEDSKEQMESLGAALRELDIKRQRLENEQFEIKREFTRSQAALTKLQREADMNAWEVANLKAFRDLHPASQLEEEKEENQRRMLNNRAAQTVREAQITSLKQMLASKQSSIDVVIKQIQQKRGELETLQEREKERKKAAQWAETQFREAMQRERERQEREKRARENREKENREKEKREKEKREKEKREKERRENEKREQERRERERREKETREQEKRDNERRKREEAELPKQRARDTQREWTEILRDWAETSRKNQEEINSVLEALQKQQEELAKRFQKSPQTSKEGQPNATWGAKLNMRPKNTATESESTDSSQSTGETTSKTSCLHDFWWKREQGRQVCEQCLKTAPLFAYRCPGCRIVACGYCRKTMRA